MSKESLEAERERVLIEISLLEAELAIYREFLISIQDGLREYR